MLRPRSCTPLLLVLTLMALLPAIAQADNEVISPSYTSANVTVLNGAGTAIHCGPDVQHGSAVWSGGSDAAGNFYSPCVHSVFIFDPSGNFTGFIAMPSPYTVMREVAASADGNAVYIVTAGADEMSLDHPDPLLYPDTGKVLRFVRSATGTWSRDTSFVINPIAWIPGADPWTIRNIAVSASGHLFVTSNAYVREYDTLGQVVSTFGGSDAGIDVAQGIAVTADGNHVWVVQQSPSSNIQRWDRIGSTDWHRGFLIGSILLSSVDGLDGLPYDGPGASDCSNVDDGKFASPYDIGLDGSGNIYVLDTSCRRIRKFSPTGVFRGDVWRNYFVGIGKEELKYHGFAVNWQGNVLVPEMARVFLRSGLPTALDTSCGPDSDLPHFTRLGRPDTSYERSVQLDIAAVDGCSSVSGLNITGDLVDGGTWVSPASRTVMLTAGSGTKNLSLTLRDAYGHLATVAISINYDASLPTPRRHVYLAGSSSTCRANPLKSMKSSGWRLADACATYSGTVLAIKHSGRSISVKILVPLTTASKMFSNAHGPVPIWVVGSRSTKTPRKLRVGFQARITSALVVDSHLGSMSGAPAWRWGRI